MTKKNPNEIPQNQARQADLQPEHRRDEVLAQKYRIISLLGRGGMGVVYHVENILLDKEFALKTVDAAAASETAIRRFQAEARAAFAVHHPNIVSVNDFGVLEDGTPFLVMEFIDGQTLTDRLKQRPMSVNDTIALFVQVCFGLAHAHENGVVHRDIKPSNIMLLRDAELGTEGSVKVVDFGIAKLSQHDVGEIQALTRTGEIFGSPLYMSPEQCTGTKVDFRADVYSLGCVLFEALTGTPPFVGDTALSTMMLHQTAEAPTLKEASLGKKFSPELERVVQRMLAKNPDERYQNLGKTAHDLGAIKSGQTTNFISDTQTTRLKAKSNTGKTVQLSRTAFGASFMAVTLFSALITAASMLIYSSMNQPPAPPPADLEPGGLVPDVDDAHVFDQQKQNQACEFTTQIIGNDDSLPALENYPDVQSLTIRSRPITDQGMGCLTKQKMLTLNLEKAAVHDVDNIVKIKTLENLNLASNPLKDDAIDKIITLKNLQHLNLGECTFSEHAIRKFERCTTLSEVIVAHCSDQFMEEMRKRMPQCRFLSYKKNPRAVINEKTDPLINDKKAYYLARYDIAFKVNPRSHAVADSWYGLSKAYFDEHDLKNARTSIDKSIQILEEIEDQAPLVEVLTHAAKVAEAQGDPIKGSKYRDRSLELARTFCFHNKSEIFKCIANAVMYPFMHNDFTKAMALCKEGLDLGERFPNADPAVVADLCEVAGWHYLIAEKDNKTARSYFDKELKYAERVQVHSPDIYARALASIAHCQGPDQKENMLKAVAMIEKLNFPPSITLLQHYADCCLMLCNFYTNNEKNPTAAADYMRKAYEVVHVRMRKYPAQYAADIKLREVPYATGLYYRLKGIGQDSEANELAKQYNLKTK